MRVTLSVSAYAAVCICIWVLSFFVGCYSSSIIAIDPECVVHHIIHKLMKCFGPNFALKSVN